MPSISVPAPRAEELAPRSQQGGPFPHLPLTRGGAERAEPRARIGGRSARRSRDGWGQLQTFLYALDGELGFTELMSVFNYACRPEDPAPATGAGCTENVYWLDRVDPATAEYDRGGFLDGAVRKYGMTSAQATAVQRLGNEHGVSEITN